jgi:cellulose synthase operon protein C
MISASPVSTPSPSVRPIGFERYNRNLSEFTLGQGGYFSPQSSQTVGLATDFQSSEGRDYVVHGNFSPGWATNFQASSPMFPLGDNGERFPVQHQSGANVSGEGPFAYRIGDRLALGGLVRFRQSPQYNELLVGLTLKLSFSPRAALFSSDLPTAAFLIGSPER